MRPAALARLCAALMLLHSASAVVVRHDNSPVCVANLPLCDAKCKGQDYFFICSAGSGPDGGPYVVCRCAAPALPVGGNQQGERARWRPGPVQPRQPAGIRQPRASITHSSTAALPLATPSPAVARLVLDPEVGWPGSNACNQKTWANDCTTQVTAVINGTSVSFIPAVKAAFNEDCAPAPGLVIGPKGTQAAVVFPQYPIGLTSTGPDGTVQIDFSATASDDPNQMDWSKCILTYRVVGGSFLDPRVAQAQAQAQALLQQQALLAAQQAAASAQQQAMGGAAGARAGASALAAAVAGVVAAAALARFL
jgi:hypothetical protein